MSELFHIIYVGASVGWVSLLARPIRHRAGWARATFVTLSGLFLLLGMYGLALDWHYWEPPKSLRLDLDFYAEGIRGFILGCFFVLLISGELQGKKILKDEIVA